MRDFDLTYAAYAEFQRGMERYWSLRWLKQEGLETIDATVRREDLVKFDHLPLLQRVPSVTSAKPGQRVRLKIEAIDLLTLGFSCRYLETLSETLVAVDDLDDESELEFIATEASNDVAEAEAAAENGEAAASDSPTV